MRECDTSDLICLCDFACYSAAMYDLRDLDNVTRSYMLAEFDSDVSDGTLYESAVVRASRTADYVDAQRRALESGDPETLAVDIATSGMLESVQANGNRVNAEAASKRLSAGQYGAYYARAVSARAVDEGTQVVVYRARESSNPRPGSDAKVGMVLSPVELLADLRSNSSSPAGFSVLPEVNSGITVQLIQRHMG
jgi:hypothetical protein